VLAQSVVHIVQNTKRPSEIRNRLGLSGPKLNLSEIRPTTLVRSFGVFDSVSLISRTQVSLRFEKREIGTKLTAYQHSKANGQELSREGSREGYYFPALWGSGKLHVHKRSVIYTFPSKPQDEDLTEIFSLPSIYTDNVVDPRRLSSSIQKLKRQFEGSKIRFFARDCFECMCIC
jgi:hypothetical protein